MKDTADIKGGGNAHTVASGQLKSLIERIERLETDKQGIADDIKDVYAEAKGNGFAPKVMKAIVKRRKMSRAEREEFDTILDTYENALGVFG